MLKQRGEISGTAHLPQGVYAILTADQRYEDDSLTIEPKVNDVWVITVKAAKPFSLRLWWDDRDA
jgi:hypothetical protein